MKLYGNDALALTYYGAIPSVLSKTRAGRLFFTPDKSNYTVKVATGVKSPVLGTLTSVSVPFTNMVVKLEFLVSIGF